MGLEMVFSQQSNLLYVAKTEEVVSNGKRPSQTNQEEISSVALLSPAFRVMPLSYVIKLTFYVQSPFKLLFVW